MGRDDLVSCEALGDETSVTYQVRDELATNSLCWLLSSLNPPITIFSYSARVKILLMMSSSPEYPTIIYQSVPPSRLVQRSLTVEKQLYQRLQYASALLSHSNDFISRTSSRIMKIDRIGNRAPLMF